MNVSGPQKFAVLLVKFSDTAGTQQHDRAFYEDMFVTRGTGGLNDYWLETSLANISLDGSWVAEWKTLNTTQATFLATHPSRWDKIQGAIDAFGVNRSEVAGVVAIFNAPLGDAGSCGPGSGVLCGPEDQNLTFFAHETGHVLGFEHSFDTSDRRLMSWSQLGEYYDDYDVMSAMNVNSDSGHRFSPRGPLLCAANMMRANWIPQARIFRPPNIASSGVYDVELNALGPGTNAGFVAAEVGGLIVEFRMDDGFDAGLARPTVLIHQPADPNAVILDSNAKSHNHEWQPGQRFEAPVEILGRKGGTFVEVVSIDPRGRKAHVRVQHVAVRPPLYFEAERLILGPGHTLVTIRDGRIVPIPEPDPRLVELFASDLEQRLEDKLNSLLDQKLAAIGRGMEGVQFRHGV